LEIADLRQDKKDALARLQELTELARTSAKRTTAPQFPDDGVCITPL
jgi:hypothetical protein